MIDYSSCQISKDEICLVSGARFSNPFSLRVNPGGIGRVPLRGIAQNRTQHFTELLCVLNDDELQSYAVLK